RSCPRSPIVDTISLDLHGLQHAITIMPCSRAREDTAQPSRLRFGRFPYTINGIGLAPNRGAPKVRAIQMSIFVVLKLVIESGIYGSTVLARNMSSSRASPTVISNLPMNATVLSREAVADDSTARMR
ncbi:hypothetical protein, partial [Paraburkholderia sp. BCC1885]|uniref:hypothetical protein n=1 Tax=Paraburkholderia sp. BCC1885 TaxID=2562669 RepID=UPI001C8FB754